MSHNHTEHIQWLYTAPFQPEALVWTPAMEEKRQNTEMLLKTAGHGTKREKRIALCVLGRLLLRTPLQAVQSSTSRVA
jgi:hypothetical protein